mgnify:CR=1 FL=1|jgi:hypothetical protein
MDAGAGSGVIGRFAELQGESLGRQQAYQDALRLTGLPVDIQVIDKADSSSKCDSIKGFNQSILSDDYLKKVY